MIAQVRTQQASATNSRGSHSRASYLRTMGNQMTEQITSPHTERALQQNSLGWASPVGLGQSLRYGLSVRK